MAGYGSMSNGCGLESNSVGHSFGSRAVLKNLSFQVEPAEIAFLAGENGAGKTTWVRIALGLLRPRRGAVFYAGMYSQEARSFLAVVFDEPPVYPAHTGSENLHLLSGRIRLDTKWKDNILSALNIDEHFLRMKAGSYSLGQRRRLALAAALLRRPRCLILDEPSVGLDPFSREIVNNCLRQLADEGTVVLLTGQDFNLMEGLLDKVIVLHDGITAFQGSPADLKALYPVTLLVRTENPQELAGILPGGSVANDTHGQYVQASFPSRREAEAMVLKLQQSEAPFLELSLRDVSLESAFKSLVAERGVH